MSHSATCALVSDGRECWLKSAILEFVQLKPLPSTVYTIKPQIYICWHFALSLDTCAELLCEASPACLHSRSVFLYCIKSLPICFRLEAQEVCWQQACYSIFWAQALCQEGKKKITTIKHDKLLTDWFRDKFCKKIWININSMCKKWCGVAVCGINCRMWLKMRLNSV